MDGKAQRDQLTDALDDALADADAATTAREKDEALHRAILAAIRITSWCDRQREALRETVREERRTA